MQGSKKSQAVETAKAIAKVWMALNVHEELFCKPSEVKKLWGGCPRIAQAINQAVIADITIGCAAIFSDQAGEGDRQNLSLINFYKTYSHLLPANSQVDQRMEDIAKLVNKMGLRDYRNKIAAHYDLRVKLGERSITAEINVDNLRELLNYGRSVLSEITFIAGLVLDKDGNKCSLDYCHSLSSREAELFLGRITEPSPVD